jgi:arsenite methyltransferase
VSQLAFDERTSKQLEALYEIADVVRRRALVRDALGVREGERVLDVGCGPGFFCAELLDEVGPGGWVTGLDSSPQMLALAERRCAGHENVSFVVADASELTVEDQSVDAALCVQVLEYVADFSTALSELHRALRPGGRAVVWDTDWATVSWHTLDQARMGRVLRAWDEHLAHPSLPQRLAPALRAAGFDEVEIAAHTFATDGRDSGSFGGFVIPLIEAFVPGHNGVGAEETEAWVAEQNELRERGEFFFAYTQFCFTARRAS